MEPLFFHRGHQTIVDPFEADWTESQYFRNPIGRFVDRGISDDDQRPREWGGDQTQRRGENDVIRRLRRAAGNSRRRRLSPRSRRHGHRILRLERRAVSLPGQQAGGVLRQRGDTASHHQLGVHSSLRTPPVRGKRGALPDRHLRQGVPVRRDHRVSTRPELSETVTERELRQ